MNQTKMNNYITEDNKVKLLASIIETITLSDPKNSDKRIMDRIEGIFKESLKIIERSNKYD